jgi:hypothetical protein
LASSEGFGIGFKEKGERRRKCNDLKIIETYFLFVSTIVKYL